MKHLTPKLIGSIVILGAFAVYAGAVSLAAWRGEETNVVPLLGFAALGLIPLMGWTVDRLQASKSGIDIDIDQSGKHE